MGTAMPLNSQHIADAETPKSRGEGLVVDDRTVYEELIAPLEGTMMRCIWRVVRRADLAEDCLQDALAVIWKKRLGIRRHPNPQALILRICLNSACDGLRKLERVRRETELSPMDYKPAIPNADRSLQEKELVQQVQQAIGRLPRKRALAVTMRLIHEEPFDTIARTLGCSEITARIHISKGRAQLRKWLAPLCQSSRQEEEDE